MTKTVLVLGGSYAGLTVIHYLLKKTLPTEKDLKVILVTKNSHFYLNFASVRALIPGTIPDEKLFGSIEEALSRYPKANWDLVLGTAEHADFATKTVAVQTAASGPRTISYDQLVIATGSNTAAANIPWKAAGTYEELLTALHDTQKRVAAAKSIIVAGAGATGVETAAELGYMYGPKSKHAAANGVKEITLLSQQPQLLGGDSLAGSARSGLESFGVKIEAGVTVTGTEEKGGMTVVSLEGGRKLTADLYMPALGLIPNTKFVDAQYRDEKGLMIVDDQYRVKGAENVWAVGDVVSKPRTSYVHLRAQVPGVAKNVEAAVKGKQGAKVGGMPFDVLIVALGPERSAGRMGFVPLPSFAGTKMKSQTLFTEMVPQMVDGSIA